MNKKIIYKAIHNIIKGYENLRGVRGVTIFLAMFRGVLRGVVLGAFNDKFDRLLRNVKVKYIYGSLETIYFFKSGFVKFSV